MPNTIGTNFSSPQVTPVLPTFDRSLPGAIDFEMIGGVSGRELADAYSGLSDRAALAKVTGKEASVGWTGFQGAEWDRNLRGGASLKLHDYSNKQSLYENKYSNRLDAAQPQSAPKPPEWGYNASLFSVGTKATADFINAQASAELAGGVKVKGEAYALRIEGRAGASAGIDLKNLTLSTTASVGASAHLAGVKGSASRQVGSDDNNVTLKANVHAYVGADADARVGLTFDPAQGTAMIGIGAEAFAGAKARASFRPSINLAGQHIADVGVKAEAWAGVGAKATADVGMEKGVFTVKAELGAALGVGASLGFDVSVDVVGTARAVRTGVGSAVDAVEDVAEAVSDAAGDAVDAVQDAAGDAVDAVQDAASDVMDAASDVAGDAKEAATSAWRSVKRWF
jgi:hypothetical protein